MTDKPQLNVMMMMMISKGFKEPVLYKKTVLHNYFCGL